MVKGAILLLNLLPVQRDDSTVLTHSFDRCPTTLIRRSPFKGNVFGLCNLSKFLRVMVQPPKFFHSGFDRVCVYRISRKVGHVRSPPVAKLTLSFTVKSGSIFVCVDTFPAKDFFSRQCVQLWTWWDFIYGRLSHNLEKASS
jgi:hypothetical protein